MSEINQQTGYVTILYAGGDADPIVDGWESYEEAIAHLRDNHRYCAGWDIMRVELVATGGGEPNPAL